MPHCPPPAARTAAFKESIVRTHRNLRPTRIAAAVQLVVLGGLIGAWQATAQAQTAAPATEQPQQMQAKRAYDIPAGALDAALERFASETGTLLAATPEVVRGKTSPGARGTFSTQAALDTLLAGTGLQAVRNAQGQYVLRKVAGVATLPTVTVHARPHGNLLEDQDDVQRRMAATSPMVIVDRSQMSVLDGKRVSDVAERLPGTFAGGPPGEKNSINLRGISNEFAGVSFDGINLPSSSGSRSIDLRRISSFIVEDVTFLRSPSAEYEANGLSGRLSIRPRAIPEEHQFEADISAGGLDELDGGNRSIKLGYAGRLNERFGLIAALGQDRFDSIKVKDRSERTYSGGGGPAQNLGFLIDESEPKRTLSTNLYFDIAHYHQGGEIHLKPFLFETKVDSNGKLRDQYNRAPGTFRQRTLSSGTEDIRTTGLTLDGKHEFNNGVEIDATLTISRAKLTRDNNDVALTSSLAFASGAADESKVDDDLWQAGLNITVPFEGVIAQRLKFGTLLRDSDQDSDSEQFTVDVNGARWQTPANVQSSLNSDYEVNEDYRAAYLQDEIKFGAWTLLPGLRYERVELGTRGVNASDVKRTFSDFLPSLPVSYRWSPNLVLRGSLAKHINRPRLDQVAPGVVTRGNRTFTGNPDLLPAKSDGIDLGFDYSKDDVFLGVNLFYRKIKDLIETLEPTSNNFVYRNVGDGTIRGLELEQRLRLATLGPDWLKPFSISANQAFLRSRVNDPTTGPREFSEQPKFISNMTLDYRPAPTGFAASLGIKHIGKRGTVSNEGAGQIKDKTIQAQTFVDLRTEWRFSPQLAIYASAENLTNQERDEIEYVNGGLFRTAIIATGRTYYLGLNWKL